MKKFYYYALCALSISVILTSCGVSNLTKEVKVSSRCYEIGDNDEYIKSTKNAIAVLEFIKDGENACVVNMKVPVTLDEAGYELSNGLYSAEYPDAVLKLMSADRHHLLDNELVITKDGEAEFKKLLSDKVVGVTAMIEFESECKITDEMAQLVADSISYYAIKDLDFPLIIRETGVIMSKRNFDAGITELDKMCKELKNQLKGRGNVGSVSEDLIVYVNKLYEELDDSKSDMSKDQKKKLRTIKKEYF